MAKKTISLQLDEEIFQSMQLLAERNARSRNAEIGVALKKYISEELGEAEHQPTQIVKTPSKGDVALTPAVTVKDNKGLL